LVSDPTPIVGRRYALHPGQRDLLVKLLEERFIESQEALGLHLLGQFHDLDDPDSFVWLRGFADMPSRRQGLTRFYDGPVWARYRDQANATMVDTDNVLLLRTPSPQAALNVPSRDPVAEARASGGVALVIAPVAEAGRALELFEREIASAAVRGGGVLLGYFLTEASPNNFPRLPIREDTNVFVFLVGYSDEAGLGAAKDILEDLARRLTEEGETSKALRLEPTRRSLLGGNSASCAFSTRST
jgi:NIPSNAP protein